MYKRLNNKKYSNKLNYVIGKLSNLYLFVFKRDSERRLPQFLYVTLLFLYFAQLSGILLSATLKSTMGYTEFTFSNLYTQIYFTILEYTRINPIISQYDSNITAPALSLIFLFMDLYLIYCCIKLCYASTKEEDNEFKINESRYNTLQIYFQISTWFVSIIRMDFNMGAIFCGFSKQENGRCFDMYDYSSFPKFYWISISIIDIITQYILEIIKLLTYNNSEFICPNSSKLRYNIYGIWKLLFTTIFISGSYINDLLMVNIMAHFLFIYFLVDYIQNYPLVNKKVTIYYCSFLFFFGIQNIFLTLWEYTNLLDENNYIMTYFTIISLFNGIIYSTLNRVAKQLMYFNIDKNSDKPLKICSYLELIYEKYQNVQNNYQEYVDIMGILNIHQQNCTQSKCPCQNPEYENQELKRQEEEKQKNMPEYEILERKALIKSNIQLKGNFLHSISQNEQEFETFVNDFIDFQFYSLLQDLQKSVKYDIIQDISLRYWFFLIKYKGNYIKSLLECKLGAYEIKEKNFGFLIVERSLTTLIENKIKENDKAYLYSYKLKDSENAKMYIRFEKFVKSENDIEDVIQNVVSIINLKKDWYLAQIEGYQTMNLYKKDTVKIMIAIEKLNKKIEKLIDLNQGNIYFLKLYSLVNSRIINNQEKSNKKEIETVQVLRKDQNLDENTVHSITILKGNVGSIIASFMQEKGRILRYSEQIPEMFGYDRTQFSQFKSIKDILPDAIADIHDLFIERLIETGTPKIMRYYRPGFGRLKSGYIVEMQIYINYYFQLSSEFAFSGLLLKSASKLKVAHITLNGFFMGINQAFGEFICPDINPRLFQKFNIGIFIPKFHEFISNFDNSQPLTYAKFKFDLPSGALIKDYIKEFMEFIAHLDTKADDYLQKLNKCLDEFSDSIKQNYFINKEDMISYEAICSIKLDWIELITGETIKTYILQFESFQNIADFALTTTSVQSSNHSVMAQDEISDLQRNKIHNSGSNFHQSQQLEPVKLRQSQLSKKQSKHDEDVNLTQRVDQTQRQDLNKKPLYNLKEAMEDQNHQNQRQETIEHKDDEGQQLQENSYGNEDNGLDETKIDEQLKEQSSQNRRSYRSIQSKVSFYQKKIDSSVINDEENINDQNQHQQEHEIHDDNQNSQNYSEQDNNIADLQQEQKEIEFEDMFNKDHDSKGESLGEGGSVRSNVDQSIIKSVNSIALDNSIPWDIMKVVIGFGSQFIVFVIQSIIMYLIFTKNANQIVSSVNLLAQYSSISNPISKIYIAQSTLSLFQSENMELETNLKQYIGEQINLAHSQYAQDLYKNFQKEVEFESQEQMYEHDFENIQINIINQERLITINELEFMKIMHENLYSIATAYNQNEILKLTDDKLSFIYDNLKQIYSSIIDQNTKIQEDIYIQSDKFTNNNMLFYIIGIILIILSFSGTLPGMYTLKVTVEKIGMCVSRIQEKEARFEIQILDLLQNHLTQKGQKYLQGNYLNYAVTKTLFTKNKVKKNSKHKHDTQKFSGYLCDKIHNNKLNYIFYFLILIILLIFANILFGVIFYFELEFSSRMDPIIDDFKQFIIASTEYGFVISTHRIQLNELYTTQNNNSESYMSNSNQIEIINSLKKDYINNFQDQHSQFFINMAYSNQYSSDFKKKLDNVNHNDICANEEVIKPSEVTLCQETEESLLTRGFQLALKTIYNTVENQDFMKWQPQQIKTYVSKVDFLNDTALHLLSLQIFYEMVNMYQQENTIIKEDLFQAMMYIVLIGGLCYVIILSIIGYIIVKNLYIQQKYMKQSILLIPYLRLSDDQTTHHLLKGIFKF